MISFADVTDQGLEVAGVVALVLADRDAEEAEFWRWLAERSAAELDRRDGLDVTARLLPMPLLAPEVRERVMVALDRMVGGEAARHAGLRPDRSDLSAGGQYMRREVATLYGCLTAGLTTQGEGEVH